MAEPGVSGAAVSVELKMVECCWQFDPMFRLEGDDLTLFARGGKSLSFQPGQEFLMQRQQVMARIRSVLEKTATSKGTSGADSSQV